MQQLKQPLSKDKERLKKYQKEIEEFLKKRGLNPKFKKEILDQQCLKKQILPEDVSKMVLYLASDVSSGCTKQNFTVDAGLI